MENILARRMREVRDRIGASQEDLANFLNVDRAAISQYESSKRTPDAEKLSKIADFYKTTTDYLLGRTDDQSPPSVEDDPDSDLQPTPRDRIKTFQKKLGELSPKSLEFLEYQIERLRELDLEEIERRKVERKDKKK